MANERVLKNTCIAFNATSNPSARAHYTTLT